MIQSNAFPAMKISAAFALASFLAASLSVPALAAPKPKEINRHGKPFPTLALPRIAKAAEIITALGQRLPEVAQWYDVDADEFKRIVQRDKSILADKEGYLAYACPGPMVLGTTTTTSGAATAAAALFPAEQTFFLHSRPGSQRKIFLDFNGHTTSGTSWNTSYNGGSSFTTPPYDQDGNPANFSATELTNIQKIWQRVVEDYAAHDVDVTTEDPGLEALRRYPSTDTAYGVRVCIGGSSNDWFKSSAGGVAYIGSFNWTSDTPCFVFTAQLGNGNDKYTGEAASHEVGHTLGLNHDGQTNGTEYYQGHANWAPIMGVGYYKDVTQFSKGDYPSANNKQDDLTVMQNYGAPRRVDDAGDSILNATELTGTTLAADGVISTRVDADLFKFTTGTGLVTFSTTTPSISPNLDVQLAIYDGIGNLVTHANPAGLPGALSATLSAGTYYLAVDGVGAGDPLTSYDDYGSVGDYTLAGTVQSTDGNQPPLAAITVSPAATGLAPLTVAFSSAGSVDADGTIVSYNWDFGDGSAEVTDADPTHVYTTPGTFTASLVVTDNGGLSGTATATITVTQDKRVFVSDIVMKLTRSGSNYVASATVTVKNLDGTAAAGARVYGSWSGSYTATTSATTNSLGQVTFKTSKKRSGTFTFTVTNVTLSGSTYDSSLNTETSDTISIP